MKITSSNKQQIDMTDLTKLFFELSNQYRNVFIATIEDNVFIYRALGRKEYRDILTNEVFSDLEKEEIICKQCVLYPEIENFDWDNCDAGIPTKLRQIILKNSFLDGLKDRYVLHDLYRSEMYDLDNQFTCIINEAFPNIDIEEIESWDVEKTMKYLSRAEWKLQNLRGIPLFDGIDDVDDLPESSDPFKHTQDPLMSKISVNYDPNVQGTDPSDLITATPVEDPYDEEVVEQKTEAKPKKKTIRGGDKEDKLTPEKIRSREEFLKKFPEFANDDVANMGIKGLEQGSVDVTSPALRPGF